jgi:hypothetical protein
MMQKVENIVASLLASGTQTLQAAGGEDNGYII